MFSLRDSIIRPEELAERLKELNQNAVAITDHGNSLGGVSIYKLLKNNNIKYIHGCEFYICDDVKIKDKDNKYYHLIALCKNETGRLNLNKLISLSGRPENKYKKPRIDFDMLSTYGDGLIITSACLAGEVSRAIMQQDAEKAMAIANKYKYRFGEDYYLEIQARREETQIEVNKKIKQIAEKLGIPCVVTTDAHYLYKNDAKYQSKYAFNGAYKEQGESYKDCYVQSEQEVRENLDYFDDTFINTVINNTHIIADKCNVEMPLSAPIMPKVDTPPQFKTNREWLEYLCEEGFKTKLNINVKDRTLQDPERKIFSKITNPETGEFLGYEESFLSPETINTYIDRYLYELNALDEMGFIDYILLVYSYANVADRRGIARGSGGGSIINYVTNITDIDPIEHGLYFERFIDVAALDLLKSGEITAKELKVPDIDLDFSGDCCEQVLQYLYNKYGEDKVASIGKFGTNQTKGTIRDMCKVLDIDLQTADRIAKSFGEYELSDIDNMLNGDIPREKAADEAIYYVQTYEELFDYVRKLNGLPKSFGLHSCGKIISTRELDEFLPSNYDESGIRYLQGDMHDVEDVGLVKIDLLGLRTIDQEFDTLQMSHESKDFLNPKQDYTDPKVLDVFRNGDTVGIFQMASSGMKQTLKKMNVSGIEDISIANALFRPGALAYIDNFCKRRNGEEQFEYLHPDLEPILKATYGIIVFQEQLIEIGRLAGLHNPDLLRKATGKKNPKLLNQVKPELEEKLKKRGWTDEQFSKLWSDMIAFASYSFNKCVAGSTKLMRVGQTKNKRHPTVEEMYLIMNDVEYAKKNNYVPLRSKFLRNGYGNALSMFSDGCIRKNYIVDIQQAGIRTVYKLVTATGKWIECTDNHKFPTPKGYKMLSDLNVGDQVYIAGRTKAYENGIPTEIDTIKSITPMREEMTYDIAMSDPAHNFLANNGIVVSNSHSSAYGIISYMTAKQKAYYPAEFYAGLCNSFLGKSDFVAEHAAEILGDADNHNIPIKAFDYKQDHRKCTVDNGAILYGIPLIKDCNRQMGDVLYNIRNRHFDNFYKLVTSLLDQGVSKKQTEILTKFDFFSDFGNSNELIHMLNAYEIVKFGKAKQIKKDKAQKLKIEPILKLYATDKNKDGSEGTNYKIADMDGLIKALESNVKAKEYPAIPFKERIKYQQEMLGFINLTTNKKEDIRKLIIINVFPLKSKDSSEPWAYRIQTKSVGSGKTAALTVKSFIYNAKPINKLDIIYAAQLNKNNKGYWYLWDYTIIG